MRFRILIVALAAVLLTVVGAVFGLRQGPSPNAEATQAAGTLAHSTTAPADQLAESIARAQSHLREVPGDYVAWAALGSEYIEQARVTADPTYYPKAEGALRRSLKLRRSGNPAALVGLGALANARHEFAAARTLARRVLRTDSYSADAYGVLADAQTQLGNATAATDAVQHMLDLRPGLASYSRASYDLEQQGRLSDAIALMRRALRDAVDPADIAFCRYQLGELAWRTGRIDGAAAEYSAGRAADPAYLPFLAGEGRVAAARGQTDVALADYAHLTARYPSPMYLMEYANLLRAVGQPMRAEQQLALADAALRLFTANGGTDDLGAAQLALAEGHPKRAVEAGRREWSRRHFADVADILGWALHRTGANTEAISYARTANRLGARNPGYLFHLGMIELSLGRRGAARHDLRIALALNPHFAPLDAPVARAALKRLDAR
ncbi:MAG: tetratricopeptide repeat protein [Nocardiopsaceae bacterium]|jgi:tetratricopeptide (TPR) repeat protein|nr:tetratricopeptide repeat protein [Nocardiopsaceae bacterium]